MTPHTHAGTDIVLVGGGHAHAHVLAAFATRRSMGMCQARYENSK
jgi:hypothetical protein